MPGPIKMFMADLNWVYLDKPLRHSPPSMAQDFAFLDPQEYFDWHREFGNNLFFMQAYTFCGYAYYPTRLGPVAPGPGREILPRFRQIVKAAGFPFCSYFCVGADLAVNGLRNEWVVPGSRSTEYHGYLAPESPWTDLLCDRIQEYLEGWPSDWLLFDWFAYGSLKPTFHVQPAWFVEKPFKQIIGRAMPERASDITPAESLRYRREVLAIQFRRIRDTVKKASPKTKILFNVPYWGPEEELWVDHPMLNESDSLIAECTDERILEWLLRIRKPNQTVWTTVIGRPDGTCDPSTWRKWYERGCDFCGYAWGTPPDWKPHPSYAKGLEMVRAAFREMKARP